MLNRLQEVAGEVSVQLYRRARKKDALPSALRNLLR